jgi:uncharacterized membrane-anchored protein
MDADDLGPPGAGSFQADGSNFDADLEHTAISWWQTAAAALLVSGLAMLMAVASHHWTRALVIVLVGALLLAATFGIAGLDRWRARGSEDNQAAREIRLRSLTGITIGMVVLTVAVLLAL